MEAGVSMCMACEEMELFYAYLDEVEAGRAKAEPWLAEALGFDPAQPAADPSAADAAPSSPTSGDSTKSRPGKPGLKPGFSCDDPE